MQLRWRWLWLLGGLVGVGLALKSLVGFPWRVTFAALVAADPGLLAVAVGVGLALGVVLLLAWARGGSWLVEQLPIKLRSRLALLRRMGSGGRLLAPTLLGVWNWATQWATYHLVLQATHVEISLAASFTALVATNLSGLLRPTPANVGVVQAALVVGLLPFGIAPEQAVAARLARRGLQTLPELMLSAT